MKTRISCIAALLLLTAFTSTAQNRSVNFEKSDFAEALQKTKSENKILFVDCFTEWCGPCKMLTRDVFTNDEVADYMNEHFVSLKVDCEKGEGPGIAKRYQVSGYPTLLFIAPDGELINKFTGASSPEKFLQRVKAAVTEENSLTAKERRYREGNEDPGFLLDLFTTYKGTNDYRKATEVGQKLLSTLPEEELFTPEMWNVVEYHYISGYGSRWWDFIIDNNVRYEEKVGREKVAEKIGTTLHPYTFGYVTGKYPAGDRNRLSAIKNLTDAYQPPQKDAICSFLRMGESRSFDTFPKFFKTVRKEYENGLPLSEHYRVMSNVFDYLYDNSNKKQKKELERLVRDSYGQQNEHLQKAYGKFFDRFEEGK